MDFYNIALNYASNNISVIPVDIVTKAPLIEAWKKYQNKIAIPEELRKNFFGLNGTTGIATICGKVSGNLEFIDIDNKIDNIDELYANFKTLVNEHDSTLWSKLLIEKTQSGGYHLGYRCTTAVGRNTKLARDVNKHGEVVTIVETRAEGGYVIVAPSAGYNLIQRDFSSLQVISAEDREFLLNTGKSFNKIEDALETAKNIESGYDEEIMPERPGDAFNKNGDIIDLLIENGWTASNRNAQVIYLKRPGKNKGLSATFNHVPNKLYVFSTNAHPFEGGRAYDKFAVYSILKHNGDFKAASRTLLREGYGKIGKRIKYSSNVEATTEEPNTNTNTKKNPYNPKTQPIPFTQFFLEQKFNYRYNEVKEVVQYSDKDKDDWKDVDKIVENNLWRELNYSIDIAKSIPKNNIQQILYSEFVPQFNPFKSYFYNLPEWDGHDHIKDFIDIVKVDETQQRLWETYFTKWIVGVVATAIERGLNHTCLVLSGAQGTGKTTIFSRLVPPELKPYYAVTQMNPADKDSKIAASENFLINLDELESINREEIGHLKSLITIDQVTVRRPYDTQQKKTPRRASFCGSINRAYFLTDLTGNRRFLVVDVQEIHYQREFNLDQLYAQALDMLNDNYQFWFNPKEIEIINEHNKKYQVIAPEEELITRFYQLPDPELSETEIEHYLRVGLLQFVSATQIHDKIQKETTIKLNYNKLAQILRNMGFVQKIKFINKKTMRGYLVKTAKDNSDDVVF